MDEHHDELNLKHGRDNVYYRCEIFHIIHCGMRSTRIFIDTIIIIFAYHLEHSQVFLPPEVLLHLWPNGGQHVIRVHNDVYKRVKQPKERAVTACK